MAEATKRHRVFDIDDGGSFDRLVEETRRITRMRGGTEADATDLLQCRVLEAFVGRLQKDSMAQKSKGMNEKRAEERKPKKTDCLGAETEKKKSGLMLVLKKNQVSGGCSKWELEGCCQKDKAKTGLMISLKRKRVSEGDCENKKVKFLNEKKAGKSICLAEEQQELGPPPKAPFDLERRIKEKGGRDVQLMIKKKLTKTDLSTHQGRLLIPLKQMRKDACFLTKQEKDILSSEEKGSNGIRVMVMEPCGVDSEMVLVKWNMQTSKNYGLRTSWSKAIERNHQEAKHLAVDQFIQLWSFRVGSQLWFAIDTKAPSSSSSSSDSHCNVELEGQSTVED